MEFYQNKICVTYAELTGGDDPIMSDSNYDNYVARKKFNVVRPGKGLGTCALIEYDSMPEKLRNEYNERNGNIYEDMKELLTTTVIKVDEKARKFYDEYRYNESVPLPIEVQHEYTINASVINALLEQLSKRKAIRNSLGGSTRKLWDTVDGTVSRMRRVYGHTLPENASRLKDKMNAYKKFGYEALISGKFGNSNTVKISDEAGRFIISLKRSRVPVYTNAQIFEEYNRQAPELGFKKLKSLQAVTLFLNRPEVKLLWLDAVQGELAWKQMFTRKHRTTLPLMRDALWYSDGTKLNLYYKDIDKKTGKLTIKTTSVYEVMDAYSEVLIGYHISDTENYEAQYNAFRMAINNSKCKPYELVNDNQGGHKKLENSDFFKRIAHVSRRTAPYSGQSKTIESVFGRFQAHVLRKNWAFTGQNINTLTQESRPNVEFIAENKDKLPTYKELERIYANAREEWNSAPHPATGIARKEMYRTSVNPDTVPVSLLDMIDLFWLTTPKPSTYTASGIQIILKGKKYNYEILDQATGMPDTRFVYENGLINKKLHVMYDPCDMSMVRLYDKTATGLVYVATAQPYILIHRAIQEQKQGEAAFIHGTLDDNKKLRIEHREKVNAIENEWNTNPEQFGLRRPRLKGISKKYTESVEQKKKKPDKVPAFDVGTYEKELSNIVLDPLSRFDKY